MHRPSNPTSTMARKYREEQRAVDMASIYAEPAWQSGAKKWQGWDEAAGRKARAGRPSSARRSGNATTANTVFSTDAGRFRNWANGIKDSNMDVDYTHRKAAEAANLLQSQEERISMMMRKEQGFFMQENVQ
jgi:hypothetical protein